MDKINYKIGDLIVFEYEEYSKKKKLLEELWSLSTHQLHTK